MYAVSVRSGRVPSRHQALNIDFMYLDLDVCARCQGTETTPQKRDVPDNLKQFFNAMHKKEKQGDQSKPS